MSKPVTIGLIVITILALAVGGYSALNSHSTTITRQQFITNTQSVFNTQTQTAINTQTVTSTVTKGNGVATLPAGYYQYCNYYNCNPYPAPPGYYNWGCYSTSAGNNTVQCSGYVYKDANGCVDLLVPIDNGYWNGIQQYYYLQNLPSSYPSTGSWVTVTGQLYLQGNNPAPNGSSCPTSSIWVNSIS